MAVPTKLTNIAPAELPVIILGKILNLSKILATPQLYNPMIAPPENNKAV